MKNELVIDTLFYSGFTGSGFSNLLKSLCKRFQPQLNNESHDLAVNQADFNLEIAEVALRTLLLSKRVIVRCDDVELSMDRRKEIYTSFEKGTKGSVTNNFTNEVFFDWASEQIPDFMKYVFSCSVSYIFDALGIAEFQEICQNQERLNLLNYIIRSEHRGIAQSELSKILDIPSKVAFQQLKIFQQALITTKETLVVDRSRHGTNLDDVELNAGYYSIVWLRDRFIPSLLYKQSVYFQHTTASETFKQLELFITEFLSRSKNNVLIEREIKRAYEKKYYDLMGESGSLISSKSVLTLYKILKEVLISKNLITSKICFCEATKKLEVCLALKDVTTSLSAVDSSEELTNEENQKSLFALDNHDDFNDIDDEDAYLKDSFENERFLKNSYFRQMNSAAQANFVLSTVGSEGIALKDLCSLTDCTYKRFYQLLALMELNKIWKKSSFRKGKIFYYKVYLNYNYNNTDKKEKNISQVVPYSGLKIEKRFLTEKFSDRLKLIKSLLSEHKVATAPEISRFVSKAEDSLILMDRRTVSRLMDSFLSCNENAAIRVGEARQSERTCYKFYYDSTVFASQEEAMDCVLQRIRDRRSLACRNVKQKNEFLVSMILNSEGHSNGLEPESNLIENTKMLEKVESTNDLSVSVPEELSIVESSIKGFNFSQKYLYYYGYVQAFMQRLKILHSFLLKSIDLRESEFTTKALLNIIPLGIYLELVGVSYNNEYLNELIKNEPDQLDVILVNELDDQLKASFVGSRSIKRFETVASTALKNILLRLEVLNLVAMISEKIDYHERGMEISSEKERSCDLTNKSKFFSFKWKVIKNINLTLFCLNKSVNLVFPNDFELYWQTLRKECESWASKNLVAENIICELPSSCRLKQAFLQRNWKEKYSFPPEARRIITDLIETSLLDAKSQKLIFTSNDSLLKTLDYNGPLVKRLLKLSGLTQELLVKCLRKEFSVRSLHSSIRSSNFSRCKFKCLECGLLFLAQNSLSTHYLRIHSLNRLDFEPSRTDVNVNTSRNTVRYESDTFDFSATWNILIKSSKDYQKFILVRNNNTWYRCFLEESFMSSQEIKIIESLYDLPNERVKAITFACVSKQDESESIVSTMHDDLSVQEQSIVGLFQIHESEKLNLIQFIRSMMKEQVYQLCGMLVFALKLLLSNERYINFYGSLNISFSQPLDLFLSADLRSPLLLMAAQTYSEDFNFSPVSWLLIIHTLLRQSQKRVFARTVKKCFFLPSIKTLCFMLNTLMFPVSSSKNWQGFCRPELQLDSHVFRMKGVKDIDCFCNVIDSNYCVRVLELAFFLSPLFSCRSWFRNSALNYQDAREILIHTWQQMLLIKRTVRFSNKVKQVKYVLHSSNFNEVLTSAAFYLMFGRVQHYVSEFERVKQFAAALRLSEGTVDLNVMSLRDVNVYFDILSVESNEVIAKIMDHDFKQQNISCANSFNHGVNNVRVELEIANAMRLIQTKLSNPVGEEFLENGLNQSYESKNVRKQIISDSYLTLSEDEGYLEDIEIGSRHLNGINAHLYKTFPVTDLQCSISYSVQQSSSMKRMFYLLVHCLNIHLMFDETSLLLDLNRCPHSALVFDAFVVNKQPFYWHTSSNQGLFEVRYLLDNACFYTEKLIYPSNERTVKQKIARENNFMDWNTFVEYVQIFYKSELNWSKLLETGGEEVLSTSIVNCYALIAESKLNGCSYEDLFTASKAWMSRSNFLVDIIFLSNIIEFAVSILEFLRSVVKVPCEQDFKYFLPSVAQLALIPVRAYEREIEVILNPSNEFKHDADNQNYYRDAEQHFENHVKSFRAGNEESIFDIEQLLLLYSGDAILTNSVCRSIFVPDEVWRVYGPCPGNLMRHIGLVKEIKDSEDSKFRLRNVAWLLQEDMKLKNYYEELQQWLADARLRLSINAGLESNVEVKSTEFFSSYYVQSASFIRPDGRLNDTLIALLLSRIYLWIRDNPLCTASVIHKHVLAMLPICEVKYLCSLLLHGGFIEKNGSCAGFVASNLSLGLS